MIPARSGGSSVVVVVHSGAASPVQDPPEHESFFVHASPSSQSLPFESFALQLSAASLHDSEQSPSPSAPGHGLPACWEHVPFEHVSPPLQKSPSSHGPDPNALAGQSGLVPLQCSAGSQAPVLGRHSPAR